MLLNLLGSLACLLVEPKITTLRGLLHQSVQVVIVAHHLILEKQRKSISCLKHQRPLLYLITSQLASLQTVCGEFA